MQARGYYGHSTRDYRTGRYRLTESSYESCARLPFHSHANAHFCLVLSGEYTERVNGRRIVRRPGDLIYYAAGVGHAERHHASGRHFMIELEPELAESVECRAQSWAISSGGGRTLATRLFADFRRGGTAERIDALIESLLDQATRRERLTRGWLSEVARKLAEAPQGGPELERLARDAGVHPVYLGRAFRRAYGCTPGEYQRRLRVERAQRALAGAAELADVAYDAGFCDQSHLNRVFKRATGVAPGEYRRLVAPLD